MENKNFVNLSGQVVTEPKLIEVDGKDNKKIQFWEMKVEAPRLSGEVDVLPVTIPCKSNVEIKKGDFIKVSGLFRSWDKVVDGKIKLRLYVAGRTYSVSKTPFADENSVLLQGFIVKPVQFRLTPFGREIADIFIANNGHNLTSYIPCIVWGKNARFAAGIEMGSQIEITGRIQSREYEKRIGDTVEKRTTYELSGDSIAIIRQPNKHTQSSTNETATSKNLKD